MKKEININSNYLKFVFILLFIFSLLYPLLLSAAEPKFQQPDIPLLGDVNEKTGIPENIEKAKEGIENLKEKEFNFNTRNNLSNILLKNDIISSIDAFFEKISFVFRILFGVPYSFTLTLLFIVAIWIIFLSKMPSVIHSITPLSKGMSWIGSLLVMIILAQVQIIRIVGQMIYKLLLLANLLWVQIVIFVIIIILLILITLAWNYLSNSLSEDREKRDEKEEKINRKILKETIKGIERT